MAARILEDRPPLGESALRAAIRRAQRTDEAAAVARLLEEAAVDPAQRPRIEARALRLAERVREAGGDQLGVEAFLHEYSLSTREGVMLMCLAEALLRIPDPETSDRLIRDKLSFGDWARHLGHSESLFVNASTWGLMLTGRFVRVDLDQDGEVGTRFTRLVQRLGEPVVRQAVLQAMRVLGRHFVLGQTIEGAIRRAREPEQKGYRYSYDMLGEAARTEADAERYQHAYRDAIAAIIEAARGADLMARPGISIKLSALHPRYELAKHRRLAAELLPRVLALLQQARAGDIAVTIDAEESERLEPSLDLFARLAAAPELEGWDGLGLAVQAYQKRAIHVVAWLAELARRERRRIPVRLVKGAYWDSEIKRAQEHGLEQYPVFTRKLATDVSYLACARRLLAGGETFYPQFATHNAQTLASIVELAGPRRDFEFQRLHGMGEALYEGLRSEAPDIPCRVYAPVGSHQDLLPYLVRRLLENGANTSFVNRILDPAIPLESLVGDPAVQLARTEPKANPKIPLPPALYGARRRNSRGLDLADPEELARLAERIAADLAPGLVARPGRRGRRGQPAAGARSGRPVARARQRRRGRSGRGRPGGRSGRARLRRVAPDAARGARRLPRARGRSLRGACAGAARLVRARGRQDHGRRRGRGARGGRLPALLRPAGARAGAAPRPAGPDRREQPHRPARPRRVRRDQPLELPARDLHRPDRGRAGGRQCGAREARAADPADRRPGGRAPARGRGSPRTP